MANEDIRAHVRADAALQERLDRASAELATAQMTESGGGTRDVVVVADPTHLQKRRRISDSLLRELRQQDPASAALREVAIEPADALQALIPKGVAVIEYYLMPAQLQRPEMVFAFVVTKDRVSGVDLSTTVTRLDELVRAFRAQLLPAEMRVDKQDEKSAGGSASSSWEELATDLYRTLITPVIPFLGEKKVLWIVPSGPLHYLPFAALRSERYLTEDFTLSYLPSTNVLRFLKPWVPATATRLAAFVNPDCGDPALDLPGAAEEASLIWLNGRSPKCWEGATATKDNVVHACKAHEVVHLACHASFRVDHPMSSFLQLAGAENRTGRWELREILHEFIPTSMVVLSACSSLYPEVAPGEEVLSLAYAFLHAGTSTVVGSLWKVSDEACPLLMQSYYEHLSTHHTAEALRRAQLAMIRSSKFNHPRFWAAFQVVGIADHTEPTENDQPESVEARFCQLKEKGIHAAETGAHADAVRHLTAALEVQPSDTDVWDLCGAAHRLLGNLQEAYRCFQEALARGRSDHTFLVRLGDTCQLLELHEEAARHYERALQLAPADIPTLTRVADLRRQQGRVEESVRYADRALTVDPCAAEALAVKAIACHQLERFDEAIDLGRQALAAGDGSPYLHLALATDLTGKMQIREAREHALKCLRLNFEVEHVQDILRFLRKVERKNGPPSISPEVDEAMRQAQTALGSGQPDDALVHLEEATRLSPESSLIWTNYGAMLGMAGDVSAAKDCLQKSVELDETDPDAWFNLARIHANLREFMQAARCLRTALEIDDEFADALVLHAQLLTIQGKVSEAIASIEKVERLAPDDPEIARLLADLRCQERAKR